MSVHLLHAQVRTIKIKYAHTPSISLLGCMCVFDSDTMSVHLLHGDIDGVCACVCDTMSVHLLHADVEGVCVYLIHTHSPSNLATIVSIIIDSNTLHGTDVRETGL